MKTLVLVAALGLLVAACGVKSDLVRPSGQPTARDQPDPSRPTNPIGR